MDYNPSYNDKYIKYKTKYLLLKSENNIQTGGINMTEWNRKWMVRVKKRQKELVGMKNTNSYIPKNKLSTINKEYYIHDNGGRPFKVIANNKGISIYGICINKETDEPQYPKLITKITNFLGYWPGFDSSPYLMHGNSILIQLTKTKYICVGWDIYSFETNSEILDYISPVGNSDVPYPVAYDKDNIYFMNDKVFNEASKFKTIANVVNAEDIYGEFYKTESGKKFKKIKIIREREDDYLNC
jgi:hypothetical protein